MSVKIVVVFTVLALTAIEIVSSVSLQERDSVETDNGDDLTEDKLDGRYQENYEDKEEDLGEYNLNTNRAYNYGIDLLYSGQEQSGQFNSKGEPAVIGEYFFVENGKEYKVSYVADDRGYRPKITIMETTKDSPPTYQGREETGEYTFKKYYKQYKVKYVVDEKGFRPTEVEVKPLIPLLPPAITPPPVAAPPVPYDPLIVASLLGGG